MLNQVQVGRISGKQAAALLGVCLRQERRLMASYRSRGAARLPARRSEVDVESDSV